MVASHSYVVNIPTGHIGNDVNKAVLDFRYQNLLRVGQRESMPVASMDVVKELGRLVDITLFRSSRRLLLVGDRISR